MGKVGLFRMETLSKDLCGCEEGDHAKAWRLESHQIKPRRSKEASVAEVE